LPGDIYAVVAVSEKKEKRRDLERNAKFRIEIYRGSKDGAELWSMEYGYV
jgi:hypothetical protein